MRESDMENVNPPILDAMTHLGGLIKEGDFVAGYDLNLLSSINQDIDTNKGFQKYLKKNRSVDVVIVKKHYPKREHHHRRRWKLKSMVKDRDYTNDKHAQIRENNDREDFMRDLEEDFDLRCRINIYKKNNSDGNDETKSAVSENDEDVPKIPYVVLIVFDLTFFFLLWF